MTYLQQFKQKSIEGGFDLHKSQVFDSFGDNISEALHTRDPLFWQCAGKALGWPIEDGLTLRVEGYLGHWHRFIDHIADHKDPEEYFKNILTK